MMFRRDLIELTANNMQTAFPATPLPFMVCYCAVKEKLKELKNTTLL